MHSGTLRALAWDQIVDLVQGFALTPLGAARLAELQPHTDPHRVSQLLAATTEGVKYFDGNPGFSLHAPDDLESILASVAVEGRPLEPLRLIAFADFLDSVGQTCASIRRVSGPYPQMKAVADNCGQFKPQIAEVKRQIDPSGEVNDSASPELARLRTQLRKQRTRLRSTLESYLRGKETSKYLQDQVISDRDGRYVLVVKAEHRTSIPGIIHGSSGSGASLYLEPLSTVEINNEIVAVEQQEREEVLRILTVLTDAFRAKPIELRQALDAATELDVIQAKARCAHLVNGVAPTLAADGRLELRGARHPLLIPGVIARLSQETRAEALGHRGQVAQDFSPVSRRDPVPVDVLVIPPTTVLLITGPNTGGKTVALKTAGLSALMAQAGLWVPAIEARLPIFRVVFADIGDEQSIAENLSTFSWHITNIASMDRDLALPALVLLDELGAGTDPLEGGALGVAIIEHFRTRGAMVISTTHYDALKTYAATTPGVTAAGFGFTPDTYEPTYHILYGSPGRSLALEMAGRLGLNGSIIDNARKNLSEREAQLAEHLAKMDTDLRALEHERRLVKRERESLVEADSRAKSREDALRQREETFKLKLNEKLDERLREARLQIDTIVGDLRKQASSVQRPSTGDTGRLRGEARAALDSAAEHVRRDDAVASPAPPEQTRPAEVGDRVLIKGLGLEGTVVMTHEREAEVDVRGKRFRAHAEDLSVLGTPARQEPATVRVNVHVQPREHSSSELLLVGQTVDQAIDRLEKFLDESLLNDQRTLRLIHGFGTGRLKEAIGEFLSRHPLVTHVRIATPEEGGGGVTIAELKD